MAENKSNIGTNLVIGVLSLIAVFSLVDISKEINKIFSPARVEKPSQLEKQAQTINITPNDTLSYENKKYIVKSDPTGKLNLTPYGERK